MRRLWNTPRRVGIWTGFAGLLISALVSWYVHTNNQAQVEARFKVLANEAADEITKSFALYEYGLRGARGAVIAAGGEAITRTMFEAYMASRESSREFPGARGFGFIRRSAAGNDAVFEARARADGAKDFKIRELAPHTGERFVIEYIYPQEANTGAAGLDLASESSRKAAAEAAAREGQPRLSEPITLVQAGGAPRRGFLLLLPVYRKGAPTHTPDARLNSTIGWVYAPLVVDEVLKGLNPAGNALAIELTFGGEAQPFFDSESGASKTVAPPALSNQRDLQVFGTKWTLRARALPALEDGLSQVALVSVMGIGALVSVLLGLLTTVVLLRRRYGDQARGDVTGRKVSLYNFLTSQLVGQAFLLYVIFMVGFLLVTYDREWAIAQERTRQALASVVDGRVTRLTTALDVRRKTLMFLANTPPIQGLVRAEKTGLDAQANSTRELWQLRLQQIFSAFLVSNPEIYQARFIGLADGGRELVRVQRNAGRIEVVPESALQKKGSRDYLLETQRLSANETLVSSVDLNRENGALEVPYRPTIRYSTPVHRPDGTVFGIVIFNVDIADSVSSAATRLANGGTLYITNGDGDYLLHPYAGKQFGFDLGERRRWQDDFSPQGTPQTILSLSTQFWKNEEGQFLVASTTLRPNSASETGVLRFIASYPEKQMRMETMDVVLIRLTAPLVGGAIALLMLYLYWASVQRSLQVRQQRLQMAAIVDQSMDAIVGLDAHGNVVTWNLAAQQMFGVGESGAIGRPLTDVTGMDFPLGALQPNIGSSTGHQGGSVQVEDRNGLTFDMSSVALANQSEDSAVAVSVTLRDITLEREARQGILDLNRNLEKQVGDRTLDLQRQQERLNNILTGTNVGTWEWNVRTGETRINDRGAGMLGRTLAELDPLNVRVWQTLIHPDDKARADTMLQAHFAGKDDFYACDFRMQHRNAEWVWVQARGRVVTQTADGAPEWMYGTLQDITAVKLAELKVKEVANLLASVLSAATEVSVIATNTKGVITIFNSGAERLLGYEASEMVAVQTTASIHLRSELLARNAELSREIGRPMPTAKTLVYLAERDGADQRVWTYVHKLGHHIPVFLAITAIRDELGQIVGYLGLAQDISERLRSEAALRTAKEVAENANAAKSMFLANMSHEIRTPMNAVIGIAHLLESTTLTADQRQLLGKLQIAGRSLLGIINDVLDLAKIEAGELSVESVPMVPGDLLLELGHLFSPQVDAKGIALEVHGMEKVPPLIMGDPLRMRQILVNLVSNAIKFTKQGAVRVELKVEPGESAADSPWLRWSVKDSGIGIAPEVLDKLFSPFVQADSTTTRQFGGTGLGLSIVRRLASLMSGTVGVNSTLGQGSEFWVRLPLVHCDSDVAPQDTNVAPSLEVAIADDSDVDLQILARVCKSLGWRAAEFGSGESLLAHFSKPGVKLPDALIVDWNMPLMDGLATLQKLVEIHGRQRLPAVVMVTGHDRSAIAALDQQQLADEILAKPVGPSELFNAVNHAVARHTGNTDRVAMSTKVDSVDSKWLIGVQLLVVDDSAINLEVAKRLLEREGAIVSTAMDGAQAVARLETAEIRFDAVLMDVQMPVMDGYEATRRIRADLKLTHLPVIALTAGALNEERLKAKSAGMTDFLTKPLDPPVLIRTLRKTIEQARGAAIRLEPGSQQHDLPQNWPAIAGVDAKAAASRLGQDADMFLSLLGRLLNEYDSEGLLSMAVGTAVLEREALMARMHKLRGSSGLLGVTEVHKLAGLAETALRAGAAGPAVQAIVKSLTLALEKLGKAATPLLEAHQAANAQALALRAGAAGGAEVSLEALLALLRQQDLSAGQEFQRISQALLVRWGAPKYHQFQTLMEQLDFAGAQQFLETTGKLS
ncbi:MAG: CHASE domain-containing protein [Rhodoferax sp.]|nr:CHASE domain-containing protein [Rhodoferax sp.]